MTAKTTINQQDLAGGFTPAPSSTQAAGALSDDEIANVLERLQHIDFAKLETRDAQIHVRVMQALLAKIVARHDQFVRMKSEAEARTQTAEARASQADLATMLAKLDKDLRPAKRRWWRFGSSAS